MSWFYLVIAGIFEIVWAIGLKESEGFSNIPYTIFTIVAMTFSVYFLSLSVKNIPLGTAYAVWTGIGTIGTVIFGILFFKEPTNAIRFLCIALILAGIVGLKLY
ncbi:multidrug efflux SMR transporter [bacterium]|nr:multidrug efflux SMR transporter [bacterium]